METGREPEGRVLLLSLSASSSPLCGFLKSRPLKMQYLFVTRQLFCDKASLYGLILFTYIVGWNFVVLCQDDCAVL